MGRNDSKKPVFLIYIKFLVGKWCFMYRKKDMSGAFLQTEKHAVRLLLYGKSTRKRLFVLYLLARI